MKNSIVVDGKKRTCVIYDNGGPDAPDGSIDRYTVILRAYRDKGLGCMVYPYLACSESPFQSFGQQGEAYESIRGKHLGKRGAFEDVPPDVKKFILQEF